MILGTLQDGKGSGIAEGKVSKTHYSQIASALTSDFNVK